VNSVLPINPLEADVGQEINYELETRHNPIA